MRFTMSEKKDKKVKIIFGNGDVRGTTERNLPNALKTIEEAKKLAEEAGMPEEQIRYLFDIQIVKEED